MLSRVLYRVGLFGKRLHRFFQVDGKECQVSATSKKEERSIGIRDSLPKSSKSPPVRSSTREASNPTKITNNLEKYQAAICFYAISMLSKISYWFEYSDLLSGVLQLAWRFQASDVIHGRQIDYFTSIFTF